MSASEMAALTQTHGLSERGANATKPPFSYLHAFFKAMAEPYEPSERPEGYVNLAVAQNMLTVDAVQQRLSAAMQKEQPSTTAGYDNMRGSDRLRTAMAKHLKRVVAPNADADAIHPDRLCISSGCGAVIDNLFMTISSPGDGVLIPAPYYPAFDNDLRVRNKVHAIPVPGSTDTTLPSIRQLGDAINAATAKNCEVRALLLTNPSNPLGVVYSDAEMKKIARAVLQGGLHVVVDEVYASSQYGEVDETNGSHPFVSALNWKAEDFVGPDWPNEDVRNAMATHLHVVYGLSKDFCASGYRVGVLSTRNEQIIKAMDNVAYFCCVPGPMQFAVSEMLEDEQWVNSFLNLNSANLKQAHGVLTWVLHDHSVPVTPSTHGMFIWIDLSKWMTEQTWEEEHRLWMTCFEDPKVKLVMTPGRDCRHPKPGCFRMCFAAVQIGTLEVAAKRLVELLGRYK
jgi:1-aminocyclopropane-1-carboxylate synthase|tara:strand:+ start:10373 stop:11734 length:1362 start_codon:yes stop_codon:yes gene_type:complete